MRSNFSAPWSEKHSKYLSDASRENWAKIMKSVSCQTSTRTLYPIEFEDIYSRSQDRRDNCSQLATKAYVWKGTCDDLISLNVSRHLTTAEKDYSKIKGEYSNSVLDDEGVQTVLEWADSLPNTTLAYIQYEAYGGVFATQKNDMTPWTHRDAVWSVQIGAGAKKDESEDSPSYKWIRGIAGALEKYFDGGNYQNYCDLDLGEDFGKRSWGADNFARLRQIKAQYDPLDVFHIAQSIPLP
ncbi:Berberine bridge enzyme-like 13 [Phytophthora citrophthora]|uniref:Berberine bridge enzyme-like 13 n=1 Tax=Phytophthora citrophthora TaxID=4793 RepID=A0AAD9FYD5_9STRA|nr:Berberine bridge enzyme-like 13 [Phytophthora citrophthora]